MLEMQVLSHLLDLLVLFFPCPKSSKSAKKIFFMLGEVDLILKIFFGEILPKFMACVHKGEKKNFFIKNTLYKACKKHKKIAFCTPIRVGR